jgi:hypothetical protein
MRSIQTRYAIVVAACIAAAAPVGVAADREPEYAAIDVPGATFTNAQGINPQGDIVGWYVNASSTHGYLLRDGAFGKIDYPGAAYTDARGINMRWVNTYGS